LIYDFVHLGMSKLSPSGITINPLKQGEEMKVKLVALAALVFMMISTPALANSKNKIHTLCKNTIKSIPNDTGRIELNGFRRQDKSPVARYRVYIDGERRQLNCVYDVQSNSVSLSDRKTGISI